MKRNRLSAFLMSILNYKIQYIIIALVFSIACSNKKTESSKNNNTDLIYTFFSAKNQRNFKTISACIADSILWVDMGYTIASNKTEFYENFKWDSVFNPVYKIIDFDTLTTNSYELTVAKLCDRIKYLHDTSTVIKQTMIIENQVISKITVTEYLVFDVEKWTSRRDSLVNWVNINHPELNGYVNDITMSGGENYLKAIELYSNAMAQ